MAVGLRVRSNAWGVGSQDFLHAFFSTVAHRLEPEGWGSRFPALQHELYRGGASAEQVPALRAELAEIHERLDQFPPSEVVWDVEISQPDRRGATTSVPRSRTSRTTS